RRLAAAEMTRIAGPPDPSAWAFAAEAFESLPRPYSAVYCRLQQAEAVIASHEPRSTATSLLRQANEAANALGAVGLTHEIAVLARRARIELEAPRADSGREVSLERRLGLTSREMEVLRLLPAGRANREI